MVDLGQKKVELSTFFYAIFSTKKMLPEIFPAAFCFNQKPKVFIFSLRISLQLLPSSQH